MFLPGSVVNVLMLMRFINIVGCDHVSEMLGDYTIALYYSEADSVTGLLLPKCKIL